MQKTNPKYDAYIRILEEELCPAMGCTEPIALAYAAAVARKTLGELPDKVAVGASGSIIKNVKSVIVPNTNHMKGIPAAAAAGIVAGDPERELEVIANVSEEQIAGIRTFLERAEITVDHIENGFTFEIVVTLYKGSSSAMVRIVNFHTNIVHIEKDGVALKDVPVHGEGDEGLTDRSLLNMEDIWDFAKTVEIADVKELLDRQIAYNMAIAEEGLRGDYGSGIGKLILSGHAADLRTKARAYAAAGSDARMNGCELPVIINSGSGNQGITVSVPVIICAREIGANQETLYRALVVSNLTAIHQKSGIGRLSAYCGAVSAGAGAGAGIAYLNGKERTIAEHTVLNAVSIISGMICDGAKASCAAKIAESVDAAFLGYQMSLAGRNFQGGDGIAADGIEETIRNVGRLAHDGMKQTNEEVIAIMIGK